MSSLSVKTLFDRMQNLFRSSSRNRSVMYIPGTTKNSGTITSRPAKAILPTFGQKISAFSRWRVSIKPAIERSHPSAFSISLSLHLCIPTLATPFPKCASSVFSPLLLLLSRSRHPPCPLTMHPRLSTTRPPTLCLSILTPRVCSALTSASETSMAHPAHPGPQAHTLAGTSATMVTCSLS